jgi:hypothetical protein
MPDLPGQFPNSSTPATPSKTSLLKPMLWGAGAAAVQSSFSEALRQQGHTGKAAALDLASATAGVMMNLFSDNATVKNVGNGMVMAPAANLGRTYGAPVLASWIPQKQESSTTTDFRSYASQNQGTQTQTQASLQEQREEARVPEKAKAT